ncbi:hypothetical protein DW548_03315 [Campylobacter coli]|nr:hypothetical protein [Campylobacter coli]
MTSAVDIFIKNLKNEALLIENKEQYDYKFYKGDISDIRQAFLNNDIQYFVNFWNCKNKNKYFETQHPLLNHIMTRAVFSVQFGTANFVLMIDENNQYPWIIGQCQSLVDSIIVNDKLYVISTVMQVDLFKEIHRLSEINTSSLKYKDIEFGYLLSQNRPFHHFYDQLRYFYYMDKPKKIFDNKSFFIPNHAEKTSEGLVYVFPTGICVNQIGSRSAYAKISSTIADILDDYLEKQMLKNSLDSKSYINNKKYELNLWFSICSEKRVWLQQTSGYVNIIKELLKYYSNIRVFFDGITAKEGEVIDYKQDYRIYDKIKISLKDVSKNKYEFVPLIGVDYKTKIYYANEINFFIASGGTAPIVPSRICRKPGIIIGNSNTYNLGMKNENTIVIELDRIQDVVAMRYSAFQNFHISWEYIFSLMCQYFKLEFNDSIPNNNEVVLQWIFDSIKDLSKYKQSWQSFLLELIEIFEQANLIDIADILLEKVVVFLDENTKIKYINKKKIYQEYCSKKQFESTIAELKSLLSQKELQLQNKTNELKNLQEDIIHKKQLLEVQNLEQDLNLKSLQTKEIQENINLKTLEKTKIQKELDQYNNVVYIERYHQSAKQRIYNHLSYKLGFCAIKKSKTLWGWISMPIILLSIFISHKQEQKIYQEKIKKDPSLKLPSLELYTDYQEARKEENSFTYKLGQAIMNANKTWYKGGYVKLWFEIRRIKLEFKNKKEKK